MCGIKQVLDKSGNLQENGSEMKKLRPLLTILFIILLLGCYEVNEEVTIGKDGSGTYQMKMDMGGLLEAFQMMATEEDLKKDEFNRSIDTTILFKDVLDSANNLTTQEKALMKNGKMHLQMNMKDKVFKADMDFPFKSYAELQQLMLGPASSAGMSNAFQNIFSPGSSDPKDTVSPGITDRAVDPGIDQIGQIYDITAKDGLISKKINPERLKQLLDRPEMAQLKEFGKTGLEINYSTSIKLPRPAKKVDNPILKLSDDKRTVSVKYNLMDMLDNPEKYSWSISF